MKAKLHEEKTPLRKKKKDLEALEGCAGGFDNGNCAKAAVLVSSYYSKKPMKFWQMVLVRVEDGSEKLKRKCDQTNPAVSSPTEWL